MSKNNEPPSQEETMAALRAILPYAEEEYASLVQTAKRDGEEVGQGEAKVALTKAHEVIKKQEEYERKARMNRGGITTQTC